MRGLTLCVLITLVTQSSSQEDDDRLLVEQASNDDGEQAQLVDKLASNLAERGLKEELWRLRRTDLDGTSLAKAGHLPMFASSLSASKVALPQPVHAGLRLPLSSRPLAVSRNAALRAMHVHHVDVVDTVYKEALTPPEAEKIDESAADLAEAEPIAPEKRGGWLDEMRRRFEGLIHGNDKRGTEYIYTGGPSSTAGVPAADSFEVSPQEVLDYGLYFFGPNDTARRHRKGEANPFFTGTNDIVLYVHGWSGWGDPGRTSRSFRETFKHNGLGCSCHPDADLRDAWVKKGFNVAVFYWDNFAAEALHVNCERKIWTTESSVGMRYSTPKGSETKGAPKVPAAAILRDAIQEVMSDCQEGVRLRLVGHSMGSQMALLSSFLLAERVEQGLIPERYLPYRIAMLDPYWSPKTPFVNSQDWLSTSVLELENRSSVDQQWLNNALKLEQINGSYNYADISTASLSLSFARYLFQRFDTLFEIYTSCPFLTQPPLGYQGPADELVSDGIAALVRFRPNFCHALDWPSRHLSAVCMYLWSMTFDHLSPATAATPGVPSAAISDVHLREARGGEWEENWEAEPGLEACAVPGTGYRQLQAPVKLRSLQPPEPEPLVPEQALQPEDASWRPWLRFLPGRSKAAEPIAVSEAPAVPIFFSAKTSSRFAMTTVAAHLGLFLWMVTLVLFLFRPCPWPIVRPRWNATVGSYGGSYVSTDILVIDSLATV